MARSGPSRKLQRGEDGVALRALGHPGDWPLVKRKKVGVLQTLFKTYLQNGKT